MEANFDDNYLSRKFFPKNVRKEKSFKGTRNKKNSSNDDLINVHSTHMRREIRYSPLAHYFVTYSWGGLRAGYQSDISCII